MRPAHSLPLIAVGEKPLNWRRIYHLAAVVCSLSLSCVLVVFLDEKREASGECAKDLSKEIVAERFMTVITIDDARWLARRWRRQKSFLFLSRNEMILKWRIHQSYRKVIYFTIYIFTISHISFEPHRRVLPAPPRRCRVKTRLNNLSCAINIHPCDFPLQNSPPPPKTRLLVPVARRKRSFLQAPAERKLFEWFPIDYGTFILGQQIRPICRGEADERKPFLCLEKPIICHGFRLYAQ